MHARKRQVLLLGIFLAVLGGIAFWLIPPFFSPAHPTKAAVPFSESAGAANGLPAFTLPEGVQVRFIDVAKPAGIDFRHVDGRTDMQYLMDSTGPGIGWIDYDQDGLMDLFLVQGSTFVGPAPSPAATCKLYKNMGEGRFVDVTDKVGLGHVGCGQGVAVGDIDNDGFPDLFLTCYGKPNVLYHNEDNGKGGRHFVDVTARAGMAEHPDWLTRPNWSTSAAFLDYNNDGFLDLFVCSYVAVDFDMAKYPKCTIQGRRGPCPPSRFKGTRCVLYRNNGNGTFTIASKEAGIDAPNAKALGVVAVDFDDDGLIDIFVSNDGVPNFLFRNLGKGKFEEVALASGCAVNGAGMPQAYMGVDAGDLHGNGRQDLFVTAFSRETNTVYRNDGKGQFLDSFQSSGMGPASWFKLGFGTCFLDVDRDGRLDIFVANGHVARDVELDGDPSITFHQASQLFLNRGNGRFADISRQAGDYFDKRYVARGVAPCDYDNDGHTDLAISNSGEGPVLLHNESRNPNHWVRLELRGSKSNRDAVGAKATLFLEGGSKIVRQRKGGGSYLSASDPRLLIGVGSATRIEKVEIRWPLGQTEVFGPLDVDRGYLLVEGKSEVLARP